ncbi:MAG: acyl-phosphate glycerol 3-phosphate acyltransferase [Dehalococcoidia bacterium]|jgi:glycerol-3-phosphate acyltransferase PlsY|nr:acyl-phosphate glycerol 3-phosphate acyltransferase [Dehalococcoidia bacterium]|tara:strand:- start:1731 stop:2366 length:636 start_codon:yes stop_codon:yes gene_type:complete
MNDLFLFILSILSCYLIGSISFGRIISKLSKNIDITSQGSGNTGATNVLRSIGVSYGLLVLFLDMLKSIIPVLIIENYEFSSINYATQIAALSAIIGHCYPIFHNFKGGKGVATGIGPLFVIFMPAATSALIAFVIAILISRMVSVGSILGCLVSLLFMIIFNLMNLFENSWIDLIYLVPAISIIIYKHNENIKRIISGTENKLTFNKNEN